MKSPHLKIFLLGFSILLSKNPPAHSQINQWTSKGIGGGGALFSPSFSPHNSNEAYMSCDMSELFHTTNLGLSWSEIDFREIQGNNGTKVQFTNNPQILYCLNNQDDLMTPFKSTDGGLTWNPVLSDPTTGEAYSFCVDLNNSNNLLISSYTNLYFSSNGGTSFSLRYSDPNGCYIAGAFFDGSNIFVGTNAGVLLSTNSGVSFSIAAIGGIPPAEAMVSFTGAREGIVVRFFCITLASGDIYPGITGADHSGYLNTYSMDWGQLSWSVSNTGINSSHNPFFVSMCRTNINVAYLGGGSDAGEPTIYKTTNGGNSWSSVFITNNNQNIFTGWSGHGGDRGWSYGEYALGFDCASNDPGKVIITDLGCAHITTNGGASWSQAYLNSNDQNPMNALTPARKNYRGIGLENTSSWWLSWYDTNNLFASYSDIRGIRSTDGGNYWSFNYTGHTNNSMYYSLKHPANGNLYAATSTVHDMYQSTYLTDARIDGGTGKILFSTNKGQTWQSLHDFPDPVIWLALDPNNLNKMYASVIHSSAGGIYVSGNIQNGSASTWTKITNPPRTEGHPFNIKVLNDGTLLCSYSGRRTISGNFTASSGIFISTNAGVSWIDRSDPGMFYWTKDIVVDPHVISQNTWYCCVYSGWGGPPNGLGGLYKTTNRGINWNRISNLDRVGSCTISPVNPNEMYFATEVDGLWYSSNINSPSPAFTQVSGYTFRHPERIFYNPNNTNEVWITSFGNGLKVGYVNALPVILNITIVIEGFWDGVAQVRDTVKIYLRNNLSPYNAIDSSAVFLNSSGNAIPSFLNAPDGNYYLQVKHRNAIETWSSAPLAFTRGQTTNYNFSSSQSQAYGTNQILKLGKWCFFSGDVNKDGIIDASDISVVDNAVFSSVQGYVAEDVSGDNFVDAADLSYVDNNAARGVILLRP